MLLEIGAQCPAYDCWKVGLEYSCKYCRGKRGEYSNGIDCGFSRVPTHEPRFKVGDYAYGYPGLRCKIRKVVWDGRFEWTYTFERERNSRSENAVFLTKKEYEESEMMKIAANLKIRINAYCEKYHVLPETMAKKLLSE